jgi:hypothetical protein
VSRRKVTRDVLLRWLSGAWAQWILLQLSIFVTPTHLSSSQDRSRLQCKTVLSNQHGN